jgi:hypothetical protein
MEVKFFSYKENDVVFVFDEKMNYAVICPSMPILYYENNGIDFTKNIISIAPLYNIYKNSKFIIYVGSCDIDCDYLDILDLLNCAFKEQPNFGVVNFILKYNNGYIIIGNNISYIQKQVERLK